MAMLETERRGFPLGKILVVVVLVALAVRTIDVLLILFLAIILAVYLDATADFLERRLGVPPALGLLAGVLLSLGALAGTIFLIVPAVADQVTDLLTNLPQFLADLDRNINGIIRRVPVLGRRATGSAQPGLLATSLGEVFGFLRGAAVPYLKGGVTFLIEG
ncbi:MAG TPA: AI-2E family transporter, partial [Gemmatimonadales bacterium]|nr:AI-2E family transporter [Gemmatimonadales bacterium]